MAKLVSKTYGEALFELACEENKTDVLFEEVKAVSEALKDNKDFLNFLNNPKINVEEKHQLVEDVFKQFVSADLIGFIRLIIEKNRQNELEAILEYFIAQVKEYKNIGVVYVTTPVELNDKQKENVVNKVLETTKYETLEMNYSIDETLLGGMVIRIGDRVVDSSIKTKLEDMTRELYKLRVE